MIVYRITRRLYASDLTGTGAKLYGGRWNRKGVSVLYTASSRSLATVELLVHLPMSNVPRDLALITVNVPDKFEPAIVEDSELPPNWRSFPAPTKLAEIGTAWAVTWESLVLRVPSAVVPYEFNYLINPLHPDMESVSIVNIEKYNFDGRLFG